MPHLRNVSDSELNERSSFRKLMKRYRKSRRSGAFVQAAENAHLQNKRKPFVKDCAHIEVFQNNYKQRLLQQAITMKSGYFNEVSGFFCVILFVGITSV